MIEYWKHIAMIADDAYYTKWIKEAGKLDHHDGFLNYLEPFLGGVMLDIGSNIGTHTYRYARYGTVLAFEPNPEAFECLTHNMMGFENVYLYNMAVGNGKHDFIDMSPVEDGNYGAIYTTPGNEIPTIAIDALELHACNFIKIDIEGDEIEALEGAEETIRKYRPVMCIEANQHTLCRKGLTVDDLVAAIHNLGYACKQRVPPDISADLLCLPT